MSHSRVTSRFRVASMLLMLSLAPAGAVAETITLGGVGSLTPVVKLLGIEYAKKNAGIEINVIHPPMGSSGGIRALAAGKVDVALSGRNTKPDEAGKSKPWLQTPMVLATMGGKSNGLSRSQVADIYGGRKTAWDDNKPIRLVLRGEQETETAVLRSMSPEVNAAVADALKRPGLPIAENDIDAVELLAKISGSLGSTTLGLVTASGTKLTALAIDGVMPSVKTAEDGSYTLVRQFYVVTSPTPSPATAAFVAWLGSPAALALARKHNYLPLK